MNTNDMRLVFEATQFAVTSHHGQLRGDGKTPYVNHVIDVGRRVFEAGYTDPEVIVAALLHDTIEDTQVTPAEIKSRFGARVSEMVLDLTLPKAIGRDWRAKEAHQIRKMLEMPDEGIAIKIADKTSNLNDLVMAPPNWSAKGIAGYTESAKKIVLAAPIRDHRIRLLLTSFMETEETVTRHYGGKS